MTRTLMPVKHVLARTWVMVTGYASILLTLGAAVLGRSDPEVLVAGDRF